MGKEIAPNDSVDIESETDDKKKQKMKELRSLNEDAFEDLVLAVETKTPVGRTVFQLLRSSMKVDSFEEGDAREAWMKLERKFEPKKAPNRIRLKKKIQSLKLQYGQDPEIYIAVLEDLVGQYRDAKGRWDDDETLEHICGNLPKCYDSTVAPLEKRINDPDDPLDIDELREDLALKYQKMNPKSMEADLDEDEEIGLFAGGFKGKCHNCGKYGHKKSQCWELNGGKRGGSGKGGGGGRGNGGNNGEETRTCFYCKQKGHISFNCPKLKARKEKERAMLATDDNDSGIALSMLCDFDGYDWCDEISEEESKDESYVHVGEEIEDEDEVALTVLDELDDLALRSMDTRREVSEIFIADTGASGHMSWTTDGMTNLRKCEDKITIGNGQNIKATMVGDKHGVITGRDGVKRKVVFKGTKYVPELAPYNLCSVTHCLEEGFDLSNNGKMIVLKKGNFTLEFDKEIKTKNGYVCGVRVETEDDHELAAPAIKDGTVDIMRFHDLLGHKGEAKTRAVASYYGVKLTGKWRACTHCAEAKAKAAAIPKSVDEGKRSKTPGERLAFDVSSIKAKSYGGAKFWLLVMDDATGFIWSFFLKYKSQVKDKMIELIKDLDKKQGYKVKYLRCDNAGENLKVEEECLKLGLGITMEYTSPNTPQQNGRVKRKFATYIVE